MQLQKAVWAGMRMNISFYVALFFKITPEIYSTSGFTDLCDCCMAERSIRVFLFIDAHAALVLKFLSAKSKIIYEFGG